MGRTGAGVLWSFTPVGAFRSRVAIVGSWLDIIGLTV
jgi:hypothetical protein